MTYVDRKASKDHSVCCDFCPPTSKVMVLIVECVQWSEPIMQHFIHPIIFYLTKCSGTRSRCTACSGAVRDFVSRPWHAKPTVGHWPMSGRRWASSSLVFVMCPILLLALFDLCRPSLALAGPCWPLSEAFNVCWICSRARQWLKSLWSAV